MTSLSCRAVLFATLLAVAGPAQAVAQAQSADERVRDFATQIARDVEADQVGGITAAVFQGPDVIWARGFGYADREAGIPAGVGTVYRTGSISKTFTALLLALLVPDGVLGLDDPVAASLPEIEQVTQRPPGASPVTYRHLASHTAGWVREPSNPDMVVGPIELWEERVLESIPITSYYAAPGASYRYSNIGFGVLGVALSRAAGRPFMELVTERVIQPLGMEGTTFVPDERLQRRLAKGYANNRDGEVDTEQPAREHRGRGYKVPNGGVYSTVGDLARFAAALSGHGGPDLLDRSMRAEMLAVQTPEDPDNGYGLGLSIRTSDRGDVLAGHGGSVAGYNAHLVFDLKTGLGVVLMRNYNVGRTNLGQAGNRLLEALLETRALVPTPSGSVPR